jgi:hypothetical protein
MYHSGIFPEGLRKYKNSFRRISWSSIRDLVLRTPGYELALQTVHFMANKHDFVFLQLILTESMNSPSWGILQSKYSHKKVVNAILNRSFLWSPRNDQRDRTEGSEDTEGLCIVSVFTSRILTTDLSQSHCNFNSHMKSSCHSLIPFLPFLQPPISKTRPNSLPTTVLYSLLLCFNYSCPAEHFL